MEISVSNGSSNIINRNQKKLINYSDVYYSSQYVKLYEELENGEVITFTFENDYGKVEYTFIKRKIPLLVGGKQFYDITTAYGYGGPEICHLGNIKPLLEEYFDAFHNYCRENDIVSEFIRFHLFENEEFKSNFSGEIGFIGSHISRNLKEPMNLNFHNTIGRAVRKAGKAGLSVSFDTSGDCIDNFLGIYTETMDRNNAKDFYYFNKDFFNKMHRNLDNHFVYANALYQNEIVASILVLFGEKYAYFFLGGTLREYLSTEASTLIQYNIIQYLKEKGIDYYTLGGGYKGNDGLYKYKKKFDENGIYPFYVGKKIHEQSIYNKLVETRNLNEDIDTESSFFPLYRI